MVGVGKLLEGFLQDRLLVRADTLTNLNSISGITDEILLLDLETASQSDVDIKAAAL